MTDSQGFSPYSMCRFSGSGWRSMNLLIVYHRGGGFVKPPAGIKISRKIFSGPKRTAPLPTGAMRSSLLCIRMRAA